MQRIIVIAKNTFKEAIRDRILYGILAFALIYIFLDLFFAKVAAGNMVMTKSFGLGGIYLFGLVITIFLGSSIISEEVENRTLYFVLTKPVSRRDVILGKFFGLFAAVALTIVLMAVVYAGVIFYETGQWDWLGLLAIVYQIMEMGLFVAMLVFFSTFISPLMATMSSTILLFLGHMFDTMLVNAETIGAGIYKAVLIISYVFPNLEKFNIRNLVVHDINVSAEHFVGVLFYGIFYGAILLYFAYEFFKRREL